MEGASRAGGPEEKGEERVRLLRWTVRCIALSLALSLAGPLWAQRVLLMPPEQTQGPPSSLWIGTGLAVALGETLTQGGMQTVPFEDLRSYYEQAGLVEAPSFTLPSQLGLARQFGVGVLVGGTYEVAGESVSVNLKAFSTTGDLRQLASFQETQNLKELLSLARKLSEDLAKALGRAWVPPAALSPQAFESYIRGRISADPTLQEVYFRKAIEIQKDYYDASCYLALVLKSTGRLSESTSLLTELEKKTYSKAYLGLLTLAEIRMEQGRLPEARRLLLASLKASESAEGHIELSKWYARQNKTKEALTELVVAERFGAHQEDIDALRRQIQEARPPR